MENNTEIEYRVEGDPSVRRVSYSGLLRDLEKAIEEDVGERVYLYALERSDTSADSIVSGLAGRRTVRDLAGLTPDTPAVDWTGLSDRMLRGALEGCRSAIPVSFGTDSDDFVPIPRGARGGRRVSVTVWPFWYLLESVTDGDVVAVPWSSVDPEVRGIYFPAPSKNDISGVVMDNARAMARAVSAANDPNMIVSVNGTISLNSPLQHAGQDVFWMLVRASGTVFDAGTAGDPLRCPVAAVVSPSCVAMRRDTQVADKVATIARNLAGSGMDEVQIVVEDAASGQVALLRTFDNDSMTAAFAINRVHEAELPSLMAAVNVVFGIMNERLGTWFPRMSRRMNERYMRVAYSSGWWNGVVLRKRSTAASSQWMLTPTARGARDGDAYRVVTSKEGAWKVSLSHKVIRDIKDRAGEMDSAKLHEYAMDTWSLRPHEAEVAVRDAKMAYMWKRDTHASPIVVVTRSGSISLKNVSGLTMLRSLRAVVMSMASLGMLHMPGSDEAPSATATGATTPNVNPFGDVSDSDSDSGSDSDSDSGSDSDSAGSVSAGSVSAGSDSVSAGSDSDSGSVSAGSDSDSDSVSADSDSDSAGSDSDSDSAGSDSDSDSAGSDSGEDYSDEDSRPEWVRDGDSDRESESSDPDSSDPEDAGSSASSDASRDSDSDSDPDPSAGRELFEASTLRDLKKNAPRLFKSGYSRVCQRNRQPVGTSREPAIPWVRVDGRYYSCPATWCSKSRSEPLPNGKCPMGEKPMTRSSKYAHPGKVRHGSNMPCCFTRRHAEGCGYDSPMNEARARTRYVVGGTFRDASNRERDMVVMGKQSSLRASVRLLLTQGLPDLHLTKGKVAKVSRESPGEAMRAALGLTRDRFRESVLDVTPAEFVGLYGGEGVQAFATWPVGDAQAPPAFGFSEAEWAVVVRAWASWREWVLTDSADLDESVFDLQRLGRLNPAGIAVHVLEVIDGETDEIYYVPPADPVPAGRHAFVVVSRAHWREVRNARTYQRVYSNVVFVAHKETTLVVDSAERLVPPEYLTHPGSGRPWVRDAVNVRLGVRQVGYVHPSTRVFVPFARSQGLRDPAGEWVTLREAMAGPLERDPAVVNRVLAEYGSPVRLHGAQYRAPGGSTLVDLDDAEAVARFEDGLYVAPAAPRDFSVDPELDAMRRCLDRVTTNAPLRRALWVMRHAACPWPMAARVRVLGIVEAEQGFDVATPVSVWTAVVALPDYDVNTKIRLRMTDVPSRAFLVVANDDNLIDNVSVRGHRVLAAMPDRSVPSPGVTFTVR